MTGHVNQPSINAQWNGVGVAPIRPVPATTRRATPITAPSLGPDPQAGHADQPCSGIHSRVVGVAPLRPVPAIKDPALPTARASSGPDPMHAKEQLVTATLTPSVAIIDDSISRSAASRLADPHLAFAADVLDDIERVRIANSHRLRIMTLDVDAVDDDGVSRGFGLPADAPEVASLAAIVAGLHCGAKTATARRRGCCLEHAAELDLRARLRAHPLVGWVTEAKGVGDKQGARLLAAVGDPYWNSLHNRPRLVSELWSYCGMGDAAKQVRTRGSKANWSSTAKMRTYLVAVSIIKAGGPYREVYDVARTKYAGAVHETECRRCGPAGRPALAGSPISDGHAHGRGLRAVGKEVLRDLWRAAREIHGREPVLPWPRPEVTQDTPS